MTDVESCVQPLVSPTSPISSGIWHAVVIQIVVECMGGWLALSRSYAHIGSSAGSFLHFTGTAVTTNQHLAESETHSRMSLVVARLDRALGLDTTGSQRG